MEKNLHVIDFWLIMQVELLCRLFCFHLTVTEDIFKLGCLHECSEVCVKMGGEADRFADAQNNQLEIQ